MECRHYYTRSFKKFVTSAYYFGNLHVAQNISVLLAGLEPATFGYPSIFHY